MNQIILSGRLTADPEIRYAQNKDQTAYCYFSLAVTREYDRDKADFIRCKVFGRSAEILDEYTKKGSLILIRGRWETGSYEDNKGNTVYTNECLVERVELLGSRKEDTEKEDQGSRRRGRR